MASGERTTSMMSPRRSSSKLDEYRIVHFNTPRAGEHKFCSNEIRTSLYSWWNFAPKILFEEFSKLPYFYFLFMTVLQCIPAVSNTSGFPTLAPILTLMVSASAAIKLIEDRARHRADKEANNSPTQCKGDASLRDSVWKDIKVCDVSTSLAPSTTRHHLPLPPPTTTSRHLAPPPATTSRHRIKVGDVIRITNHQAVPADVLVLAAHEPEPAVPRGACHVETKVRVRVRVS